jgi:hypothetical protein
MDIAILDSGFEGYDSLLGSELPANVVTRSFRADERMDEGQHGTACAEIVYDMAPGAQLYLVASETDGENLEAISWLIEQGVDVISASFGNPLWGPGDGTGPVHDKIDEATARGIVWVNSAGNFGEDHWSGSWNDQDGNGLLEFQPGDEGNTFTLTKGESATVYLRWNDPWDGSCNDYDLAVYDNHGLEAGLLSNNLQDCNTAEPWEAAEVMTAVFDREFTIKIKRSNADGQADFDLFVYCQDCSALSHVTPEGSVSAPADAVGSLTVGAVDWLSPDTIEDFSSRGPTEDGRVKPDLVGPDHVSTATYNPGLFGGTSASAPHVAGAAALVKQANPGFSPQQIRDFLEGRAVELGSAGKDNVYGSGRLSLGAAPAPVPSPTPTATPAPGAGVLRNCPGAGKWAMSAWDGQGAIAAEQALATCSGGVQAAYWLDPTTQGWLRYLRDHSELSNLGMLQPSQAVLALAPTSGGAQAAGPSATYNVTAVEQAGGVENCAQAGKWAMSTWSGPDDADAAQAMATCTGGVEAAYWLNPETQSWLRYVRGAPDVSNLVTLNRMQAFYTLGSAVPPIVTPTPVPSPTPTPTPTATGAGCPAPGTYSGLTSGGGLFEFDVEECAVSEVRIAEWVPCADPLTMPAVAEFAYDPPLAIVGGAFTGQGSQTQAGLFDSSWHISAQFSGQFTSAADAQGEADIQAEVTGWPAQGAISCDTEPPLTWSASQQ